MSQFIGLVTLVVPDYDQAIAWYCDKLGFELVEDSPQGEGKRWVVVRPRGSQAGLLLAKAKGDAQQAAIGQQAGGRVFLFLNTDDFWRDYQAMAAKGVHFVEQPREEPYATVVVFEDGFGNKWDLLQPK
ncbi:VOC family protein [Gallaecimonas kandeliae]|nr:VOC family protein [Gallaecimonas kandeliae]WKE64569.1 VOC family protein [Gallaecimonas kandeliae]